MRVLIMRTNENYVKSAIRMMPYNSDEDKKNVYAYITEMQNKAFGADKFYSYSQANIGFDIYITDEKDKDEAANKCNDFLNENKEYDSYNKLFFEAGDICGVAVFKKWECVEEAHKLKLIKNNVYEALREADRHNIKIEIESLGALKNDELLHRIAVNIAQEIKNDTEIADLLRLGDTRKKENKISYKNWVSEDGNDYSSITIQNGGQAFSVLFDADMNFLTAKYNSHIFQDGKTWIPFEDAEPKECLLAIFNKMSDMEFNDWLADMGENKTYVTIKEEINKVLPEAKISGYYPLKSLGNGYFTVSQDNLTLAVEIKDDKLTGYRYRESDDKIKSKWLNCCPDKNSPLYQIAVQLMHTGHVTEIKKDIYDLKISMLKDMLDCTYKNISSIENKNELGIDEKLDALIEQTDLTSRIVSLQMQVPVPIEIEEDNDIPAANTDISEER